MDVECVRCHKWRKHDCHGMCHSCYRTDRKERLDKVKPWRKKLAKRLRSWARKLEKV